MTWKEKESRHFVELGQVKKKPAWVKLTHATQVNSCRGNMDIHFGNEQKCLGKEQNSCYNQG